MCLKRRDKIIVFIQTDLPEPVVPAISKWGMDAKSPTIGLPEIFFLVRLVILSLFLKLVLSKISLRYTFSLERFGSSIPMVLLPGIVDILADSELVFLAMSSERLIIFETFMHCSWLKLIKSHNRTVANFFIFFH